MIAVESSTGDFIKALPHFTPGEYGFHKEFGFISKKGAEQRAHLRKLQGYDYTSDSWHCLFHLFKNEKELVLDSKGSCDTLRTADGWMVNTTIGNFRITECSSTALDSLLMDNEDANSWLGRITEILFLIMMLLVPIFFLVESVPEEEKKEEIVEPVTVKIIKPVQTVKIQQSVSKDIKVKPLNKKDVSKRAVKRNLGFLGMLGSKDLKKVTGGVPQDLKNVTAGAGPGGNAGSGGEVLAGLGKGLRKTTVGNTGVKGLGGVGTKGAGGGAGGYGNTLVASGEGKGVSAIAVSSSNLTLEGGLSRYAINATIAKYLNQVRRCYENELKTKPKLEGLVEMSFEINGSGRLNFANVNRTTLGDVPTEKCISTKMMSWQFPKPKGGVKVPVKYPFMLRPVGL